MARANVCTSGAVLIQLFIANCDRPMGSDQGASGILNSRQKGVIKNCRQKKSPSFNFNDVDQTT